MMSFAAILSMFCVVILVTVGGQTSSTVEAQAISIGKCPNVTVMAEFDAAQYLGAWYEIRRYPAVFEAGSKCFRAEYSLLSENDSGVLKVNNSATRRNKYTDLVGTAYAPDPNVPAKLVVNFPQVGPFLAPYWVIETDYVNYSVVYTCSQLLFSKIEYSWILGRDITLNDDAQQAVSDVLQENDINPRKYIKTKQEGCVNY